MDFTKEVKKRMIDKEVTHRELAEKMNISQAYLSDLINGSRKNRDRVLEIISILELKEEDFRDYLDQTK